MIFLLLACTQEPAVDPHARHATAPADEHAGHDMTGMDVGSGARAPVVEVTPEAVEALHISTVTVQSGSASVAMRAPALVSWDSHRLVRLTTQSGGQVRSLSLPRPGESVAKGAVVARLYQPEVKAAFEELQVAKRLGEPWLSAARSRLQATGIAKSEIDAALESGTSPDTFSVRSPIAGVVVDHLAVEGQWLATGGLLGTVGAPDALVIDMVVQGPVPAQGTLVTLNDPSSSDTWTATVATALPTAGAAGTDVRLLPTEAQPPVGRPLLAEWVVPATEGLWVPTTALVDTGTRRIVFVERGPGRYEPRPVDVGLRTQDRVQIVRGLEGEEKVVVSGAFLLDSETQIGGGAHAAHGG